MPQVKRTTLWGALLIVLSGALLTTAVALALGGTISTVAGDGTEGFGGDGGSATSAQLAGPTGVAVDSSGNLFITDINYERVRKVEAMIGASTLP